MFIEAHNHQNSDCRELYAIKGPVSLTNNLKYKKREMEREHRDKQTTNYYEQTFLDINLNN